MCFVSLVPNAVSQQLVREKGEALPDCPEDVSVQPSLSGGAYVLWNPVR